ncbi:bifunctional diguanylate cyclase/phosphodiesterase [Sulfurimonas sp.]|jgi:diguanylate cyclase (GGDEF)-like protein|uniref:putative bifunctional diguanylate cyclase/phosphodiesterase n=1 Tax=Sulfurimonas sp. TaxID=2022749 RepID=UPI0025FFEFDB|nr:bifunctional diguanylate cyclase/phosphodiesterase [Sulfurimonas sp.]MCK9473543.1 bifunctional diguanylate cyclase/phosphodiesterase [Sulfurimonas sp.]
MPKTLKNFIFSINIVLLSSLFIVVLLFTAYLHTTLAQENAIKNANTVSNQIFSSMYQVMKKGWSREDLNDFMHSIKENFDESYYSVNIYRTDKINELFGDVKENPKDDLANSVLASGEKLTIINMGKIRSLLPLNAKQECLSCHVNATVGDTLGLIDVEQNFVEIIKETFLDYVYFFLIVLPIFVLTAFLVSRYTSSKITDSLKLFNKKVQNINSMEDFKEFNSADIDSRFEEINAIILNVNELAQKLKTIAVDKDLLEFEVQLLDKFIITTEVVQDWRDFINELLVDINKVMPTYTLMTIFRIGDDQFEVDIFWFGVPDADVKVRFEEYVRESVQSSNHFLGYTDYTVRHNVSEYNRCITVRDYGNFAYRTKSLFLDTPKIGGIVGLSVQSEMAADPIKHIVIDSILTTMANLVGSVKAINKYTNDLEYYAAHDPLTGLFNQRVFVDFLEYEIKRASAHGYEFALMVIDCDNFKPINDRYGHAFGDLYLQEFARVLEESKRNEDILSRYGGDEFTLILPECGIEGALGVAHKIARTIEDFRLLATDGSYVGVTVSIGISIYPEHAKTQKELFVIADGMMYKAKEDGKNSIMIPSGDDIVSVIKEQKAKSLLLMDAVTNNRIVPYFQPIQTTISGKNEIHELLMRIEVDGKVISAYEFIEVAESMSIINRMDLMVIENAFIKMQAENYQGILFINLSPKSLIVGNYADSITQLITQYDISKDNVVFEITERETVKNFSLLEKFVMNLKMAGYKFAIDDFGSGFSSFHYIKKFPIDYLKIDGEFIININKDKKDKAFVHSILTLAKELNVKTVAEYVEDEEIVKTLKEMGVDYLQGFHIGRPQNNFTIN